MPQPVVYFAVTSHGFGHAVRTASVAAAVQEICPKIRLIFATVAPEWLLKSYVKDFEYHPRVFDFGVIQTDSLTMDKLATLTKMQTILQQQAVIIKEEVEFIRQNNVGLIVGDIPALATAIARAADIPCWMMSNFGWDFIYRAWGEAFEEIVAWIESYYGKSDRTFRLPLHESMSVFPNIIDVGLTGGTPRYSLEQLQAKFNLKASRAKTILLTFGGLGLQAIPYQSLTRFSDWQFITFDRLAPDLPNIVKITDNHDRPVDFMPFCGRVISKPGYSTFAEALRLETPIVSLTREDFAESALLIEGISNYSQHQIITPEQFCQGSWEFLEQPLLSPSLNTALPKDGTKAIAQAIIEYFE